MKPILFLDIDGVLISDKSRALSNDSHYIAPGATALVMQILRAADALLIISSTWRRASGCILALRNAGLLADYHLDWRTKPFLPEKEMIDPEHPRGSEIADWIARHDINTYCILDDEPVLPSQKNHTVTIDPYCGITSTDVKKAIEILTKTHPSYARTS